MALCCSDAPLGLGGFGGGGPRLSSAPLLLLSTPPLPPPSKGIFTMPAAVVVVMPPSAADLLVGGAKASQCACVASSSWSPRSVRLATHTAKPAASAMNAPTPVADTADVENDGGGAARPRALPPLPPRGSQKPECGWAAAAPLANCWKWCGCCVPLGDFAKESMEPRSSSGVDANVILLAAWLVLLLLSLPGSMLETAAPPRVSLEAAAWPWPAEARQPRGRAEKRYGAMRATSTASGATAARHRASQALELPLLPPARPANVLLPLLPLPLRPPVAAWARRASTSSKLRVKRRHACASRAARMLPSCRALRARSASSSANMSCSDSFFRRRVSRACRRFLARRSLRSCCCLSPPPFVPLGSAPAAVTGASAPSFERLPTATVELPHGKPHASSGLRF